MSRYVARIEVTLKPVVNDPQGLSIAQALQQLGFDSVGSVRAGKYFEVELEATDRATAEATVRDMCQRLLANPVIEDFRFTMK
jgi:phosphoribosylformylglycinamidine synthase